MFAWFDDWIGTNWPDRLSSLWQSAHSTLGQRAQLSILIFRFKTASIKCDPKLLSQGERLPHQLCQSWPPSLH